MDSLIPEPPALITSVLGSGPYDVFSAWFKAEALRENKGK